LYSVPGNHEIECDASTSQVFGMYEAYFRNPNRIASADIQPIPDDYKKSLWSCLTSSEFLGHYNYGNAFWSVQHGLVHLIGLNSYTSVLPDSPQYSWLEHELEHKVDRTVTPWLLVVFHCPLHTTFLGHNGELNPLLMLKTIEPLLVKYQVNLVVSGHDHAYLRTHPMVGTNVAVDGNGPVYWTLGAGGNREQHNKGYVHDIPEEWVAQRDLSDYGYGQFFAPNATHAQLIWVRDGTTTEGIDDNVWMKNTLQL
jgi:acid phosphatase type 7